MDIGTVPFQLSRWMEKVEREEEGGWGTGRGKERRKEVNIGECTHLSVCVYLDRSIERQCQGGYTGYAGARGSRKEGVVPRVAL